MAVDGIKRGIASIDRGEGVAHETVKDWVASWGGESERPLPERSKHDARLVARGDQRPSFAARLYRAGQPAAAQRIALHVIGTVETLLPENPSTREPKHRPSRPCPGNTRVGHSENAVHSSVPSSSRNDPDPARLPRRTSLAGEALSSVSAGHPALPPPGGACALARVAAGYAAAMATDRGS